MKGKKTKKRGFLDFREFVTNTLSNIVSMEIITLLAYILHHLHIELTLSVHLR